MCLERYDPPRRLRILGRALGREPYDKLGSKPTHSSTCYGQSGTGSCKFAALNSDGVVNILDISCVGSWYGTTCP